MLHFRSIKVVCVLFIIAITFGIILWVSNQKKDPLQFSSSKEKPFFYPIWIKGVDSKTYTNNRLLSKIKADELKVNPRKFFIFNIRPFNEVTCKQIFDLK